MPEFELLVPGIYMMRAPFGALWAGVFLVKGEENCLIDTCTGQESVDNDIIPALERIGVRPTDISWVLNTHNHGDHANGNGYFMERSGAKLACFDVSVDKFRNPLFYARETRSKYPEYSTKAPDYIPSLEPNLVLHEGDVFLGRLKIFSTPGHDTECISILDLESNSLLCGDSLQFMGTNSSAGSDIAYYKDLQTYKKTIEKIRSINPENIFASHDYVPYGFKYIGKDNVEKALKTCTDAVEQYTAWIGEALEAGVTDTVELARLLIRKTGGIEPKYIFTDMYTADEHVAEYKSKRQ